MLSRDEVDWVRKAGPFTHCLPSAISFCSASCMRAAFSLTPAAGGEGARCLIVADIFVGGDCGCEGVRVGRVSERVSECGLFYSTL
jgi:hypothetical protein